MAVGTNEAYEIKSVFLKIIFENCLSCQRCFVNISNSECSVNSILLKNFINLSANKQIWTIFENKSSSIL